MCTLRGNEAPLKRGCRFVLPAAFCRTMSTAGGAGETAPYADFNVHIDECVSLASEVVGSVVDGVDYRAKQKRCRTLKFGFFPSFVDYIGIATYLNART